MSLPATPTPEPREASHDTHNLTLIAALADRDVDPDTRRAAEALIASCGACAELATEIRALATALAELPADVDVPRDMRLTPQTADRLRRGSALRRLLRPFGANGWSGLRPVGAALTTLGLAGLLLTGASSVGLGSSAAAPPAGGFNQAASSSGVGTSTSGSIVDRAVSSAAVPEAVGPSAGPGVAPSPSSPTVPLGAVSSPATKAGALPGGTSAPATSAALGATTQSTGSPGFRSMPTLPLLAWISIVLLVAGLAIFGLRLAARRVA